jgi:hypothetical protein
MKALDTKKINIRILAILALTLFTLGCDDGKGGSGSRGNNPTPTPGTGQPPVTEPDPVVTPVGGAVVSLINVNPAVLAQFSGNTAIENQNPQDIKLTLNLQKFGTYSKGNGGFDYGFGGYASVKFKTVITNPYTNTTTTQNYEDKFESLVDDNGTVKSNSENHKYNLLSTDYPELNGNFGYHGFFEDRYGAIIVVIDAVNDAGDGEGPTGGNGSVWFKNHPREYAPLSPTSCWFVSLGPYDCRTWKSGNGVNTKQSIYPESNYTKLGNFVDLDVKTILKFD